MNDGVEALALTIAEQLAWRGGLRPTNRDRGLLMTPRVATAEAEDRLIAIGEAAFKGFFEAATDGVAFVPAQRIEHWFGNTLPRNYPEGSPTFLRFATAYWTLKVVLRELDSQQPRLLVTSLLAEIEKRVGALFFPVYGPLKIDPDRREADQRQFLSTYAPRLNVEDFMRGNAILIRDRSETHSTPRSSPRPSPSSSGSNAGFLFANGAYLTMAFLFISIMVNSITAFIALQRGLLLFSAWAALSTILLPRAVLALLLLADRSQSMALNLTLVLYRLYPRTIRRFGPNAILFGGDRINAVLVEIVKLVEWLIPASLLSADDGRRMADHLDTGSRRLTQSSRRAAFGRLPSQIVKGTCSERRRTASSLRSSRCSDRRWSWPS